MEILVLILSLALVTLGAEARVATALRNASEQGVQSGAATGLAASGTAEVRSER